MEDLKSLDLNELTSLVTELGEKRYRAKQIYRSLHKNMVDSIDDLKNLPKAFRERLKSNAYISRFKIASKLESKIDDTKKYLFELEDGHIIETVFMKYKHGNTVCISTQVGCKMGCSFCASTKRGLVRNLTAGELLNQIYCIQKDLNERISNIVLMGSGEPLDNYDNVKKFLEIINDEEGQNISYRHITLSTCGLIEEIYELADLGKPINLAISLHNPFNIERKKIMPTANKYSVKSIIEACHYYAKKTGRRISFEYTLISGENDSKKHAEELARISSGFNCHVNLIPLNTVKEYDKVKSNLRAIKEFKRILDSRGINSTIRRELGSDINAACGQLRIDFMSEREKLAR
ncbi:MAG: 23S rRNA (adenine(2503)-C(2))-methyltransferase RlmN [Andreesenia angusta]|nr:23S rRNA (adenine(2503)-C(2))-methyltransferase RlmN [Andreesenia angusta]